MSRVSSKLKSILRATSIGVLAVSALAWCQAGYAAVINTFTTLASWNAAAGAPIATEDFADTILVSGLSINIGGGGSISGGNLSNALAVFGLCIDGGAGCPGTTVFNFAPGTTAFAADWDLAPGGAGSGIFFSVHFAGGGQQTVSPGITNPAGGGTFAGFFGLVSDTSITSINLGSGFTGNGETFNADNVRFRTTGTAVPEPATFALLGFGLAGLGFSRRRQA